MQIEQTNEAVFSLSGKIMQRTFTIALLAVAFFVAVGYAFSTAADRFAEQGREHRAMVSDRYEQQWNAEQAANAKRCDMIAKQVGAPAEVQRYVSAATRGTCDGLWDARHVKATGQRPAHWLVYANGRVKSIPGVDLCQNIAGVQVNVNRADTLANYTCIVRL